MARFVVLDHSVTSPGGHNFEHATQLLRAAESLGFQPVLAANQAIENRTDLPASWQVLPLFPDSWNARHWIGPDGRSHHPAGIDGQLLPWTAHSPRPRSWRDQLRFWSTRVRDRLRTRDRRERLERFARACHALWDRLPLDAADRILLPSVTEFDLLGLVRFLAQQPASAAVDWHLMFHFNPLLGRTPSYAAQTETLDRFQRLFTTALGHVPHHRIHFYGVTDLLVEQYNRLQGITFSELPYTLNERICAASPADSTGPLRLTCPGVIRREKGKRQIRTLVQQLWHDHLQRGGLQLIFQGKPQDVRRFFPPETHAEAAFCETPAEPASAPIVIVRHPLAVREYAQLICQSQVGLFLHDQDRYFARCSGTLVELLGAGVPVIVPAGCWLSEQIAEPVYSHLDQLVASEAVIDSLTGPALAWRTKDGPVHEPRCAAGVTVPGTAQRVTCELPVPSQAVNAVFSLELASPSTRGEYVRVAVRQLDARGRCVGAGQVSVLGARRDGPSTPALFTVDRRAVALEFSVSNAYRNATLSPTVPASTSCGPNPVPRAPRIQVARWA